MLNLHNSIGGSAITSRVSAIAICAALALSTSACAKDDAEASNPEPAAVAAAETAPAVETTAADAPADHAEAKAAVKDDVENSASEQITDKRAALTDEAVEALAQTREAVKALDEGDTDAALEALAKVTGQMEIILAREPDLALVPVDVSAIRQDLIATVDGVKAIRKNIKELVEDGEIQQARPLIESFGSELVISTANIPLATYPDAIKDVTALIDDGKIEEAKVALDTALSTLVVTETIVPLPLLRAQALLDVAEASLDTEVQSETDDEAKAETTTPDVKALLENAAYEIELAKAFGYGDKTLYRQLQQDVKSLQKRVEADEDAGGLFASIRRQISGLSPKDGE